MTDNDIILKWLGKCIHDIDIADYPEEYCKICEVFCPDTPRYDLEENLWLELYKIIEKKRLDIKFTNELCEVVLNYSIHVMEQPADAFWLISASLKNRTKALAEVIKKEKQK